MLDLIGGVLTSDWVLAFLAIALVFGLMDVLLLAIDN